jgi:hypothetical protein
VNRDVSYIKITGMHNIPREREREREREEKLKFVKREGCFFLSPQADN